MHWLLQRRIHVAATDLTYFNDMPTLNGFFEMHKFRRNRLASVNRCIYAPRSVLVTSESSEGERRLYVLEPANGSREA